LLPETAKALDAAERVLRELPSSVIRSEHELVGAARGQVNWQQTQHRQLATADPTRFICRPAERRYDTPLARLVLLALRQISGLGPLAMLKDREAAGARINEVCRRADRLLNHTKLTEVTAVAFLSERTLESLHRYRHTEPLIEFVRSAREAIDLLHPDRLQSVITTQLLAPASNDTLFEMLAGFELVDALIAQGYEQRFGLITGAGVPFAVLRGPHNLTMWWQRSIWGVLGDKYLGRYRSALVASHMPLGALRPDFLLLSDLPPRLLVVEVKQTEVEGAKPERRGLLEAMAYLHDAGARIGIFPDPQALVIGWNADATPGFNRTVVTSQDEIPEAVNLILEAWSNTSI
jgi:hypothetical protein